MANGDASRAVLITGCSTGIGRATAERLAASGWKVYATARNTASLRGLEEKGCTALALDVTDDASMVEAVRTVESADGAVAALINNAGYSQSGAIESVTMDDARKQFETNVFGPARLTQLVLPKMRERRAGRIVNVSSMGGKLTFPGGGWYHATKYALEAMSDALRFEVGGFGVKVVIIEPGLIRTSFAENAVKQMDGMDEEDGPYAQFNAAVRKATEQAYVTPPLSWMGGVPENVAKTIEKAISVPRPKTRYRVTPSAHFLMNQRAILSDRLWDAFVGTQFPKPGAKG